MKANEESIRGVLHLAQSLAAQRTDEGLYHAAELLLRTIDEGCDDPEILVTGASYLLQGPLASKLETKKKAISLMDKAAVFDFDNVSVLEMVIECYELVLYDFPDKIKDILRLCLKVLDLDPEQVNCMITLARHRKDPNVALSLEDTIGMLEWAHDVEPTDKMVDLTLYQLYIEAGNYDKALNIHQEVIDRPKPAEKDELIHQQMQSLQSKSRLKRYRKYSRN